MPSPSPATTSCAPGPVFGYKSDGRRGIASPTSATHTPSRFTATKERSRTAQTPGDDLQTKCLVGSLEDAEHPSVDEKSADGVLLRISIATVDLHRFPSDPLGWFADAGPPHA